MSIKLIALDLDHTTLNDEQKLSRATIEAFNEAKARGIYIVPATGRGYFSIPKEILEFDDIDFAITSNGASITHIKSGEVIYKSCISEYSVEKVLARIKEMNLSFEIFVEGGAYLSREEYEAAIAGKIAYRNIGYVKKTRNPVDDFDAFAREHLYEIENINIYFEDIDIREQIAESFDDIDGISITSSLSYNVEIGSIDTSKANAIEMLVKWLGFSIDEVMAIGDGHNDVEMIKRAGVGVAVANAPDEVKEIADYVTASNNDDGVARAIRRFAL